MKARQFKRGGVYIYQPIKPCYHMLQACKEEEKKSKAKLHFQISMLVHMETRKYVEIPKPGSPVLRGVKGWRGLRCGDKM